MTWNLIEALTGYVTGDEWNSNGHKVGQVVTVKTHYPHREGNAEVVTKLKPGSDGQIPRAIVLLRNPQNALPSYLNFLYEVENELEGHSQRAPMEEWLTWRDHEFDAEIKQWKDHAEYWLDRYSPESRLVLSFEGLTDDIGGPRFAQELARFLDVSVGVPVIYQDSVQCVWETVIKYRGEAPLSSVEESQELRGSNPQIGSNGPNLSDSDPSKPQSRRKGNAHYPYTLAQLDRVIDVLELLRKKYGDRQLTDILDSYIRTINGVKESIKK